MLNKILIAFLMTTQAQATVHDIIGSIYSRMYRLDPIKKCINCCNEPFEECGCALCSKTTIGYAKKVRENEVQDIDNDEVCSFTEATYKIYDKSATLVGSLFLRRKLGICSFLPPKTHGLEARFTIEQNQLDKCSLICDIITAFKPELLGCKWNWNICLNGVSTIEISSFDEKTNTSLCCIRLNNGDRVTLKRFDEVRRGIYALRRKSEVGWECLQRVCRNVDSSFESDKASVRYLEFYLDIEQGYQKKEIIELCKLVEIIKDDSIDSETRSIILNS